MGGAELCHVTVPTLVIATPEDPTRPTFNARHLAEPLPRSTLVTIDGVGHAIPHVLVPQLADVLLRHVHAVDGMPG